MKMTKKSIWFKITFVALVIVVALFFLMPILWAASISFKTRIDALSIPPKLVFKPTLDHYRSIIKNSNVVHGFYNSIILTFSTLLISMIVGLPSAYAMARYNFPWKRVFLLWILIGLMIPLMALAIPFYIIYQHLGLLDTYAGMIMVYLIIDLPFVVWIMGTFFKQIPREIDEAAMIDGCSQIQTIIRVLLPIAKPGIAAATISCLIATWNEFLFALILTQTKVKTAPVVMSGFLSTSGARWGEMAALSVILMVPAIVFGVTIQKYYIQGLTAGAIKE